MQRAKNLSVRQRIDRWLAAIHIDDVVRLQLHTLRQLRERIAWYLRRRLGRLDQRIARDYCDQTSPRKLHLGAGGHELHGWLNSDLFPDSNRSIHLDATKRFPFEDQTFRFVFSEHMIEHLTYSDGVDMLGECFRVLEPGGILRVSTPDFEFLLRLYADPSSSPAADYIAWQSDWINRDSPSNTSPAEPLFVINNFLRDWGHQFVFDETALLRAFDRVGFSNVSVCRMNDSAYPELCNLEHESRAPAGFVALETLTVEGVKPR